MTKIKIRVGEVEVEYEGPESFLQKKLPELIGQLSRLEARAPSQPGQDGGGGRIRRPGADPGTLASFLKSKSVGSSGVRKFLATAEWLHLKGSKNLKTVQVTKALQDNHQGGLSNPADCLNKNVTKGHCEKVGREFFITDEGRANLG